LIIHEIVKGDGVALIAKLPADCHNVGSWRHVLQDLDHNQGFGKGGGKVLEQKLSGKIDKAGAKTAYLFNTFGEKDTGQDTCRRLVAAGIAQLRGCRAAVKQLVGKEFFMGGKDRLSSYEKIHAASLSIFVPLPAFFSPWSPIIAAYSARI
jgi:hypothetical protein